jgi:type IV pilus assembly protein PilW
MTISQKGFSLVELMVGLLIGMLVLLATTSMAVQFGQSQRAGVGANNVLGDGALALELMGHSLRQAGLGFINQVSYENGGQVCNSFDGITPFTPLSITSGGTTDTLSIAYGEGIGGVSSPKITQVPFPINLTAVQFANTAQFEENKQVVVADSAGNCALALVTAVTPTTTSFSFVGPPTNNTLVGFYPIGTLHWENWSITNGKLQFTDLNRGQVIVADNVAAMKVQFGLVDAVDNFVGYGTVGATLSRIHSVRVALVMKNINRQKGNSAQCGSSRGGIPSKDLPIDNWGITVDVSAIPDWQCYTFKVVTQTFPLRNFMWGV